MRKCFSLQLVAFLAGIDTTIYSLPLTFSLLVHSRYIQSRIILTARYTEFTPRLKYPRIRAIDKIIWTKLFRR